MWKEAEKFLSTDTYIAPLIQKWGSCTIKPIKSTQYFEDLVYSICSQQLSGKAAETIFKRVKEKLKNLTPHNILDIKDDALRSCGLSYQKIKYTKDLSAHVVDGKLKIDSLDSLTDEEIIRELTVVKGIGRWTADMFLMFSLARPDIFPTGDLGIKNSFERITGKKWDKVKSAYFAEKHWKPYRTVASWYLWRSLENK